MVEFIIGRRKSGKSRRMIQRMLEHNATGAVCYFLVPEQITLETESWIIRETGLLRGIESHGLLDIQVVSFRKLGNLLLKKTSLRSKKLLKEKGQLMILAKVIRDLEAEEKLSLYARPKENVLAEILAVVGDLCDLEDESYDEALLEESPSLKEKLVELLRIKERYLEYLGEEYIDENAFYAKLQEAVLGTELFCDAHIFVDDFYKFSNSQLGILKALMEKAGSFSMAFNADEKERDFFAVSLELLEQLEEHCSRTGLPYRKVQLQEQFFESPDLVFLENQVGRESRAVFSNLPLGLKLSKATNIDLEVKHLFEEIIRLVDGGGCSFKDIRVVCNDLGAYRNLLKLNRRLYDIPLFIDEKVNLHNHPVVRLLLGLLLLKEENNSEAILDVLRTGYLDFSHQEVELLENHVRENGIRHGKWHREIREDAVLEGSRQKVMAFLERIRKELAGDDLRSRITGLYNCLQELQVYERLQERIEGFKEKGNYNNVYIHTQLWNVLLDTFDQLATFLGDQKVEWRELHGLLKGSLGRERISILPVRQDEVLVIGSQDAFKEKSKATFLLGANEGMYPERISPEAFFPLEEGEILERLLHWKKDDLHKQSLKRLEFYHTLSIASKHLYISYSLSDSQGDGLSPAYLVKLLKKLFPGLVEQEVLQEDPNYFFSKETALIHFIKDSLSGGITAEKSRYFRIREHFSGILDNLYKFRMEEERDGRVAEALVREVLLRDGRPVFSISKLENYGSCPYKFFVSNVLHPQEQKDYELRSLDLGTLYHNVLDKVGRQDWLEEKEAGERKDLVGSIIRAEAEAQGLGRLDSNALLYQLGRIVEEGGGIVDFLREERDRDAFKPGFYELVFGEGGRVAPYSLKLADGREVSMEGKIDRVDLLERDGAAWLRVMDYKLSGKKLDYRMIRDGISFQLFVYLKALLGGGRDLYGGNPRPAGLLYTQLIREPGILDLHTGRNTASKRISGIIIDGEELSEQMPGDLIQMTKIAKEDFDNLSRQIDLKIRDHTEGILMGDFRALPYYYKSDSTGCTYCSYKSICRNKDRYRILKRSADKKVLEELRSKEW